MATRLICPYIGFEICQKSVPKDSVTLRKTSYKESNRAARGLEKFFKVRNQDAFNIVFLGNFITMLFVKIMVSQLVGGRFQGPMLGVGKATVNEIHGGL
ncbi:MAG: hypothetical protein ACRC7I_13595, partial [Selenomonadaceae bacterium]